tara:strand:- start:671 stop:1816 length:1146 start_codon:yes stop_codon:yes gene_type:complete
MSSSTNEIEEEIEEPEEECPKCPPAGLPAWMGTFADMAILLMCFFVMILSFAEFNVPKFKQITGSLNNAFGIQREIPIVEQPMGTTIISMTFSPSPSPSVTNEMTQQTTQVNQPELELQTKTKEADDGDGKAQEIMEALEQAIAKGDIQVETLGEKLVVNFAENTDERLPELLKKTLDAVEKAKNQAGQSQQDVLYGGLDQKLKKLTEEVERLQKKEAEGEDANQGSPEEQSRRAQIAEDKLTVALNQEIGQGLVAVERDEDRVIVTVGSAGAFRSGSANLTPQARAIMQRIGKLNQQGKSRINVSGHTDNVPLIFGSQYRDNWDLAAARASSVVQSLQNDGSVDGKRMQAVSFGDSRPVGDNASADGRGKNRRIEIEINY